MGHSSDVSFLVTNVESLRDYFIMYIVNSNYGIINVGN
ncbi:hypothetical protein SAMN05444146_4003 [Flavobacterium johnsoniae]|jgi:hypothetical protein|nr:hypothetical protein SAMN05444146_4003 [Flavobacterium johnsoniae]